MTLNGETRTLRYYFVKSQCHNLYSHNLMLLKNNRGMSVYHEGNIYAKRCPIHCIENSLIMSIITEIIMHFNRNWWKSFLFCNLNIFWKFKLWKICKIANLLKKRLWHRCFPVNFAKFLGTPFIKEHLWWLASERHLKRSCHM